MVSESLRRVVGEERSELGQRGQTTRSGQRLVNEEWYFRKSGIFGVERMGQGRERARIENEVGFLKPLKRRGIFVIAGRRKTGGV